LLCLLPAGRCFPGETPLWKVVAVGGMGWGGVCCKRTALAACRDDPNARSNEIAAYNAAYAAWVTPVGGGAAAAFSAVGPFSVAVDEQAWANVTSAALEPVAVEAGAGIAPYDNRTAYEATQTPFNNTVFPVEPSGAVRTLTLRDATGAVLWSRDVAFVVITNTTARQRGGAWSCRSGQLVGSRCFNSFLPTYSGMCIVIDAATMAYAGGCALSSASTADAWAASE
jgi:hypothetical protein